MPSKILGGKEKAKVAVVQASPVYMDIEIMLLILSVRKDVLISKEQQTIQQCIKVFTK